ncbi:UNVERIFIED_CONTAM: hypothetical protein H355_015296, partial [Colinus virginianus]
IAYLSGMCSEKRKCIIAEDNGLNLAFTIAHEMGHNMGINHDNDHPSCADGLHIMSGEWIKGQNLGDVSWSRCSREDLERFLRSKASSCLLQTNPQSLNSVIIPSKLPGMTYSADEQCQIIFGPTASFCQEMQVRMGIYFREYIYQLIFQLLLFMCLREREQSTFEAMFTLCYPEVQNILMFISKSFCLRQTLCYTYVFGFQHVICTGLWCKVESEKECKTKLDPPMDGTDCETGKVCFRFSYSRSDNAVLGVEGECHGPVMQYRICENPSCPAGVPTFRDWQCQALSVRSSYQKHVHQWQAVIDDEKPCALFCTPSGKDQPILLTEKVMDGTSCGQHGLDICADGKCQKFGCDGIIGSLAREDHCGVCNGNGKSCKVIKGDFNHTRGAGYVEALVIPAGARRIKVVEEKPAHSYLALRDAGKQSINSDWKIEHSGTFNIAGTTVHYVRRGLWEKISAKGPTTSPLHLLLCIPVFSAYLLYLLLGERKTTVSCTKIMNKNISLVDNKKCKYLTKPEPQIRKCNEQPCQTR